MMLICPNYMNFDQTGHGQVCYVIDRVFRVKQRGNKHVLVH